ncbi:MAG: Transcription factor rfx3, partial [Paramarteilia canceri]
EEERLKKCEAASKIEELVADELSNFSTSYRQPRTNINSPSRHSQLSSFSCSKASPITLKWLMDNFESAEGVSMPRATLYALYSEHCNENETFLEPMNAASFGKMLRSIFSGLRTRRLGTRGNSKYHYYGIKLKAHSPLHKKLSKVNQSVSEGLISDIVTQK